MLLTANARQASAISRKLSATTRLLSSEAALPQGLSPISSPPRASRSIAMNRTSIRAIVEQSFLTGYLTVDAEQQLRRLLQTTKYGGEDLQAFMLLQQAAMEGQVRQESRELLNRLSEKQELFPVCP